MSGSGSGATLTVEPVALSKGVAMKVKKIVEKAEKKIAKLRPDSKKKEKKNNKA
jgi:hypothetical protein